MLAVHQQRAGDSERDLGDAGEVLDVAAGHVRLEGVVRDVLELHAEMLAHELPAGGDDPFAVVVLRVTRYRAGRAGARSQRILDPELQLAEGRSLEGELQAVLARVERVDRQVEGQERAERKVDRPLGIDLDHREGVPGVDRDLNPIEVDRLAVERDALDAVQRCRAEAVLDREADARFRVPQAGVVVEVPEQRLGDERHGGTPAIRFPARALDTNALPPTTPRGVAIHPTE